MPKPTKQNHHINKSIGRDANRIGSKISRNEWIKNSNSAVITQDLTPAAKVALAIAGLTGGLTLIRLAEAATPSPTASSPTPPVSTPSQEMPVNTPKVEVAVMNTHFTNDNHQLSPNINWHKSDSLLTITTGNQTTKEVCGNYRLKEKSLLAADFIPPNQTEEPNGYETAKFITDNDIIIHAIEPTKSPCDLVKTIKYANKHGIKLITTGMYYEGVGPHFQITDLEKSFLAYKADPQVSTLVNEIESFSGLLIFAASDIDKNTNILRDLSELPHRFPVSFINQFKNRDHMLVVGQVGDYNQQLEKYEFFSAIGKQIEILVPPSSYKKLLQKTLKKDGITDEKILNEHIAKSRGSCLATAYVARIAAKMLLANPDLPTHKIKELLINSASEFMNIHGYRNIPILNAGAAIKAAKVYKELTIAEAQSSINAQGS
ncbi:MAG: S8 family serine peptidase, partial [Gammaproteobacteria bacterium]